MGLFKGQFAVSVGLTELQIDQMFIEASKL